MIRVLNELSGNQWSFIWDVEGGNEHCDHAYEEFDAIFEDEYTAKYACIHCGAMLLYDVSDVSDIGD